MREIVIISGKGGTGKTTLTAAFAHLAKNKIICDLDVDAPDLHILLEPQVQYEEEFISGNEAVINPDACVGCGECQERCRWEAVMAPGEGETAYRVDPLRCEGCMVCVRFCPAQAIDFPRKHCGVWYKSVTRFGPMAHAQLHPGEENSGLLVTLLKKKAREMAEEQGLDLILCDGAPGIGCPVISSLAGTNLAVVVTEPTPSGRHDLERVAQLCGHFKVPVTVIVNKADLNPQQAGQIRAYCAEKGYEVLAELPHDNQVTEAMVKRLTVTELPGSAFAEILHSAWARIEKIAGIDTPAVVAQESI